MNKILAQSLLVIIETGIEEIADRLKKRRKGNERPDELILVRSRRGAYDLCDRFATHHYPVAHMRARRKKQNTQALYI